MLSKLHMQVMYPESASPFYSSACYSLSGNCHWTKVRANMLHNSRGHCLGRQPQVVPFILYSLALGRMMALTKLSDPRIDWKLFCAFIKVLLWSRWEEILNNDDNN